MKRVMQITAGLALAFTVAACGNDARDNNRATTGTGGTVAGTSGTLDADRDFIAEQLAMGTAEVQLGRLAQEKATHPEVKSFAATMVRDHQAAADELKSIAAKIVSAQTTTRNSDAYQEEIEELSKLSGREFDRKYIEEMIDDHEEGIRDLENRAENAGNPDVKAWAAKTLPTMRQHLAQARAIKETLDRASTN